MSIGYVLSLVQSEFPAMSISKLRYLEEQGLVAPARTQSGYRKYSAADVERLRFILSSQRDHFWPLRVIRSKLEVMDASPEADDALARLPGPRRGGGAGIGLDEIATLTGASLAFVAEVGELTGVKPGRGGAEDSALIQAVESALELATHGLDLRHLRSLAQAATRNADLIESAAATHRARGSVGRERAAADAQDMAESMANLYKAVLRMVLANRGM
jgi:DNA-binding transcriptional MerR regulator